MLINFGKDSVVVPECCEAIKQTGNVYLDFDRDEGEYVTNFDKAPTWHMGHNPKMSGLVAMQYRDVQNYYRMLKSFKVSFCPYCGAKLPEIVKVKSRFKKIYTYDDTHCGTCKERAGWGCECYPPTILWDVKK